MADPEPNPAPDESEAKRRFEVYEFVDPFPNVESALLTGEDIFRYVAATGMVYPFHTTDDRLKAASYEMGIGGLCTFWDGSGNQRFQDVQKGDEFRLEANTIAFVTLESLLQVPSYVAIRFNLRIKHIYRGLLLGTGPLVDPGFVGHLALPLHNLTTNDYTFKGGEGLIWLEVTKLAVLPGQRRRRGMEPRHPAYYFNLQKRNYTVLDYIKKADDRSLTIRSSIPQVIENSAAEARKAAASAKSAHDSVNGLRRLGIIAGIALVVGLFGVMAAVLALVFQAQSTITSLQQEPKQVQQLQQTVCDIATRTNGPTPSSCASPAPTPAPLTSPKSKP